MYTQHLSVVLLLAILAITFASQLPDLSFGPPELHGGTYGGVFVDESTRTLFAIDFNDRILVWHNIDSITNTTLPDTVLGQPNMTTFLDGYCTASLTTAPNSGFAMDSAGTLWVGDSYNNRVLWWKNAASISSGSPADGVIGQPNITTCDLGRSSSRLNQPTDVSLHGSSLFVHDGGNKRVLRFDGVTLSSFPTAGAVADGVIGADDFSSTGNFTFYGGVHATADGLYVADYFHYAIYYYTWDQANLTSGGTPSFVYGQKTLANKLHMPADRSSNYGPALMTFIPSEKYFFVSDPNNRRVLLFAAPPTQNYQLAIDLFGHAGFFESSSDLGTYVYPWGVHYDSKTNSLYVLDLVGRILRFSNALGGRFNTSKVAVDIQFQPRIPKATIFPKDRGSNIRRDCGTINGFPRFWLEYYFLHRQQQHSTHLLLFPVQQYEC